MKFIYTILFFLDTILFIILTAYLFRMLDKGVANWAIFLVISGMITCIAFLAFFLRRYVKEP